MTVALALRFPWGRYHATAWGRHTNEAAIDWPPAPWRLLRALYCVWQERCPELGEPAVLELLGALSELPVYSVPPHKLGHTRHFLPSSAHTVAYDHHRDRAIDGFVTVPPQQEVVVEWPVELRPDQRSTLARLAGALPYLGRAESLCEARLIDGVPADGTRIRWSPLPPGTTADEVVELLAPSVPLDVESLVLAPREVRQGRRLRPPGTRSVAYGCDRSAAGEAVDRRQATRPRRVPTVVRWHLDARAAPPLHQAVSVAHLLRGAALSKFGERGPECEPEDRRGRLSMTLAGRAPEGDDSDRTVKRTDQHRHAHYLAYAASDGRRGIDTVAVWAPEGLGDDELKALAKLRELRPPEYVKGIHGGRLGLEGVGGPEVLPELAGPARRWESLTPFLPVRHRKRGSLRDHVIEDLLLELSFRIPEEAMPTAEAVAVLPDAGWTRFRRHRPDRSMKEARIGSFVTFEFPAPVEGPVALGALSHFGMGLFRPARARAG